MNLQSECRGDKTDHRWRMTMHMDGCHFYGTAYRCIDCGALYSITLERDFAGDPYSAIWMMDDYVEDEDRCERCRELMAGAELADERIVFEVPS